MLKQKCIFFLNMKNDRLILQLKIIFLIILFIYMGTDISLARPTSRCILFDGENISFDASLVLYIYI